MLCQKKGTPFLPGYGGRAHATPKKGAPFLPGYGGIAHATPKKRYTISTGLRW